MQKMIVLCAITWLFMTALCAVIGKKRGFRGISPNRIVFSDRGRTKGVSGNVVSPITIPVLEHKVIRSIN